MADDDKELDLEVDDDSNSGSKSKLIIILIIVVVLIGGGVGAAVMLMGGDEEETEEPPDEAVDVKLQAIYFPLKPVFVVNFATPGAQRFLQVEVNIMTRNADVVPILEQHLPLIRNNLIALFSSQEFKEVMTPEGKDALRQAALEEIQKIVEEEFGDPGVEQVLFTSFVVQ